MEEIRAGWNRKIRNEYGVGPDKLLTDEQERLMAKEGVSLTYKDRALTLTQAEWGAEWLNSISSRNQQETKPVTAKDVIAVDGHRLAVNPSLNFEVGDSFKQLGDFIGGPHTSSVYHHNTTPSFMRVFRQLEKRDQRIICARHPGFGSLTTYTALGQDFGITGSAISKRYLRALKKLQEADPNFNFVREGIILPKKFRHNKFFYRDVTISAHQPYDWLLGEVAEKEALKKAKRKYRNGEEYRLPSSFCQHRVAYNPIHRALINCFPSFSGVESATQYIFRNRYFEDKIKSQTSIGKSLGISEAEVAEIEGKTLKILSDKFPHIKIDRAPSMSQPTGCATFTFNYKESSWSAHDLAVALGVKSSPEQLDNKKKWDTAATYEPPETRNPKRKPDLWTSPKRYPENKKGRKLLIEVVCERAGFLYFNLPGDGGWIEIPKELENVPRVQRKYNFCVPKCKLLKVENRTAIPWPDDFKAKARQTSLKESRAWAREAKIIHRSKYQVTFSITAHLDDIRVPKNSGPDVDGARAEKSEARKGRKALFNKRAGFDNARY